MTQPDIQGCPRCNMSLRPTTRRCHGCGLELRPIRIELAIGDHPIVVERLIPDDTEDPSPLKP